MWGVRLVLLTDPRGLPLGYTLVPAGEKEYEPLADLLTGTPSEIVIADKGLWGRGYRERLAASGVELLTPAKERTAGNEAGERRLASVRLAIESVFSNLKGQMRLERHLAKTPAGLAVADRAAPARAHPRHPAQHPRRTTRTRPRRLRRPLIHIKPLVAARAGFRDPEGACSRSVRSSVTRGDVRRRRGLGTAGLPSWN